MDLPLPSLIPDNLNAAMKNEEKHISTYSSLAIILAVLLALTFTSVWVTGYHLGALSVVVALVIASVKVITVIINFMHLKFENLFLKLMVAGVFVMFTLVIILTFVDYYFR
jgi:cytochrome c oxidase subunit 4